MIRSQTISPYRVIVQKRLTAGVTAGLLAVGAAVASAATAAAEEPPAPAPAPPPATAADPAAAAPTGLIPPSGTLQNFLPQGGLAPGSGYDFLLSQSPLPTATGGQPAPVVMGEDGQPVPAGQPGSTILDQQAIQSMKPTNFSLAGQGQQSLYSYTPAPAGAPPPTFIDNAKGTHGIWNYGMGRLTTEQLGQPLPGTAPPPGTNIPVGLAPDPNDPTAPPPPQPPFPFTTATP